MDFSLLVVQLSFYKLKTDCSAHLCTQTQRPVRQLLIQQHGVWMIMLYTKI